MIGVTLGVGPVEQVLVEGGRLVGLGDGPGEGVGVVEVGDAVVGDGDLNGVRAGGGEGDGAGDEAAGRIDGEAGGEAGGGVEEGVAEVGVGGRGRETETVVPSGSDRSRRSWSKTGGWLGSKGKEMAIDS